MKRRIFNALAAVSVVLLLGVVGLWVRSFWVSDYLMWRSSGFYSRAISAYRGSLDILRADNFPDRFDGFFHIAVGNMTYPNWVQPSSLKWHLLGFAYYSDPDLHHGDIIHLGQAPIPAVEVSFPLWFFILFFALLPFIRWYQGEFLCRRPPGLCVKCGYDLGAHKPGDKCPECGTPVPAQVKGGAA